MSSRSRWPYLFERSLSFCVSLSGAACCQQHAEDICFILITGHRPAAVYGHSLNTLLFIQRVREVRGTLLSLALNFNTFTTEREWRYTCKIPKSNTEIFTEIRLCSLSCRELSLSCLYVSGVTCMIGRNPKKNPFSPPFFTRNDIWNHTAG